MYCSYIDAICLFVVLEVRACLEGQIVSYCESFW